MHTPASKHRRRPRSTAMPLFLFVLILNVLSPSYAAEPASTPTGGKPWRVYTEWPFSAAEAKRRQEETAKTLGIPVEKTMDLGNGVALELVLIPAGRFIMGTPKPVEPDWLTLGDDIIKGQSILVLAASTVLAFILLVLFRAWRLKRRPQMSLHFFMVLILALSLCSWGGVGWYQGLEANMAAQSEYFAAVSRFKEASNDENPAHAVTLSKPFYVGKYEVTQGQYQQVMGTNPSAVKGRSLPVDTVSSDDAVSFCKRVGEWIRLPSEAEWEYACRAGTITTYSSGDSEADLTRVVWHFGNSGWKPHPVGTKESNAFVLYDMHGNVWEWCKVIMHASYEGARRDGFGWVGMPTVNGHVRRGGAWGALPEFCRCAYRHRRTPGYRSSFIGFRVALDFQ